MVLDITFGRIDQKKKLIEFFYKNSPVLGSLECAGMMKNITWLLMMKKQEKIKHYRVDKMLKTKVLEENRVGKDAFKKENMSHYTYRLFGMFDGELKRVELLCDNSLANVIFDRFGLDTRIDKVDDEHFVARVEVAVSSIFFGWIMALEKVKVVGSDDVVDQMKKQILEQYDMYFGRENL